MPVFNANVLVPRAVPDSGTDHALPDGGALSYGGITSQSALASTNGVDALLVNGNRDRQMNGNESTRITQNRTHTIGGNQQKKVAGNKMENVVGHYLQTTIGNLHRSIIGATNDLYTDAHTVQHKANQLIHEPVAFLHKVDDFYAHHGNHHDTFFNYWLSCGTALNTIGLNVDIKPVQAALLGTNAEKRLIKAHEIDVEAEIKGLKGEIASLDSKIGAIQPAVYITMLHEVAITQKILVVGVNQFM